MTTPDRNYTHPDVLGRGVAEGWADPETDPALIDWAARQSRAAIPFGVVHGRPMNPCEYTPIRWGRNGLGRWGENLMADALVTATNVSGTIRWLLMVERGDGHGWAAARELFEETGLRVPLSACRAMPARYVPDPRASDEAWAVTIPVVMPSGPQMALPTVAGGYDARHAAWVAAHDYPSLVAALEREHGGRLFTAHQLMLAAFLGPGAS